MNRYIVRKFIEAKSINEALRKEKKQSVDEVYYDFDWESRHEARVEGINPNKNSL